MAERSRPLLPLRLERWRVLPGWRWLRLPGYARRWDRALAVERLRRDAGRCVRLSFEMAIDDTIDRLTRFSREVRRAAERGRSR